MHQGLGFRVFGLVVDKRFLVRLGGAMLSGLITVVPIIVGMVETKEPDAAIEQNQLASSAQTFANISERELIAMLAQRNNMTCTSHP